jgi:putative ABC transport system ATP-binding protein
MPRSDVKPLVTCRDVVKIYGRGANEVRALAGINLDIYPGELTMLVGPSGCGKTTLLSVVAGILKPTSGSVSVMGKEITRLSAWRLTPFRRDNVGFVFQQFNLLPVLSAAENAAVPLVIKGYSKWRAVGAAKALLGKMGMADRVNSLPGKLSGGQQQRVAIARALVHHPHLLVCDEPTSSLDAKTGHSILEHLRSIAVEGDRAVIIVTHDSRIFEFADTIARMDDGRIVSLQRRDEFEKSRYGERALAH